MWSHQTINLIKIWLGFLANNTLLTRSVTQLLHVTLLAALHHASVTAETLISTNNGRHPQFPEDRSVAGMIYRRLGVDDGEIIRVIYKAFVRSVDNAILGAKA